MFARNVSMRLKPHAAAEFTRAFEDEVIPLLRKQRGFQDEITFIAPGGLEAIGISLWEQQEDADAYDRRTSPEVQKVLAKVVEGIPQVRSYEVSNSTFHIIAARATF
jgi:heme-degrading monooxygenase HmoA